MLFPKSLIVDANILFSFFKKESARRIVLEKLLKKGTKINVPYEVFLELSNNKDKIIRYSDISSSEFEILMSLLHKHVNAFSDEQFETFIKESIDLAPHKKDLEYFALSLSLKNCPIWSDETSFKEQSKIKIFSTKELLDLLK